MFRAESFWATPSDVWSVFRGAHYVGWGYIGGVYTPSNQIVAFPGMEVLLSPVAMLSGHLGLSESYNPIFLARPTAALLLQPAEFLLTSSVVFATDALAERLDVPGRRRISLCFAVALIAFPVGALWGHAEDALAMTCCIYALVAMLDRKWSHCGWLLGFGIVIQPLVLLLLPLFVGASPAGQRAMVAVRSAALSVLLLTVAFMGNPSGTYRALVQQPADPVENHVTPWLALAPKLASGSVRAGSVVSVVHRHSHFVLSSTPGEIHQAVVVTGGLGRSLYTILAVLAGIYVWRRPQTQMRLLWLAAAILSARCFFEAVMCPYYLAPPLFLALVTVARSNRPRFWSAVAIAGDIGLRLLPPQPVGVVVAGGGRSRCRAGYRLPGWGTHRAAEGRVERIRGRDPCEGRRSESGAHGGSLNPGRRPQSGPTVCLRPGSCSRAGLQQCAGHRRPPAGCRRDRSPRRRTPARPPATG